MQHVGRSAAEQAGKAHDLARVDADRIGTRLGVFHEYASERRRRDGVLLGGVTGHGSDQIGGIELAASHQRGNASIAEHSAAVRELNDLFEAVRHVHDGGALASQAAKHSEEPLNLAVFERRRRLVENENAAIAVQGLGDGDNLLLGEAELPHWQIGIRCEVERREPRARLFAHARTIDQRSHAE